MSIKNGTWCPRMYYRCDGLYSPEMDILKLSDFYMRTEPGCTTDAMDYASQNGHLKSSNFYMRIEPKDVPI